MLAKRHGLELEREQYNVAIILSAIYNTVRDPKRKSKPFVPEDFLPKKPKTANDLINQAKVITGMFGSRKAVD